MKEGAKENPKDEEEPNEDPEGEKGGLDWLLTNDESEINPVPMDSNVLLSRCVAKYLEFLSSLQIS